MPLLLLPCRRQRRTESDEGTPANFGGGSGVSESNSQNRLKRCGCLCELVAAKASLHWAADTAPFAAASSDRPAAQAGCDGSSPGNWRFIRSTSQTRVKGWRCWPLRPDGLVLPRPLCQAPNRRPGPANDAKPAAAPDSSFGPITAGVQINWPRSFETIPPSQRIR
jgi:hypothetical protein